MTNLFFILVVLSLGNFSKITQLYTYSENSSDTGIVSGITKTTFRP